jgi:hypothetical protein
MTPAAAAAMASVIIEPENLLRMMISFCLAARYRNAMTINPKPVPPAIGCCQQG